MRTDVYICQGPIGNAGGMSSVGTMHEEEIFMLNKHDVIKFSPYPFSIGQKIHIADGPRKGDWEVIKVTDHKLTLKCPISLKEFTWSRFCYFVEEQKGVQWPQKD